MDSTLNYSGFVDLFLGPEGTPRAPSPPGASASSAVRQARGTPDRVGPESAGPESADEIGA